MDLEPVGVFLTSLPSRAEFSLLLDVINALLYTVLGSEKSVV